MPKDTFKGVFKDHLAIDPEVCRMLGKTQDEIAKMDLMTFACLIFDKGYDVSVSGFDTKGIPGKLSIVADRSETTVST